MKNYFFRTILILFLIILPISAFCAQNEDTNFNNKLDIAIQKIQMHKSFQLFFKQEFYSILRNKTTFSEGIIFIKTPNSFRFEIQKPRNEVYVSNGTDFWKYIPELRHAQHLNANSLELNYLSLLTTPNKIKTSYQVSEWTEPEAKMLNKSLSQPAVQSDFPPARSADKVSIKLEPKGDKQQKVLYAILNLRKGVLDELRVVQLNGNRVRLLFSLGEKKEFDKNTFSFTPPTGIMVDHN